MNITRGGTAVGHQRCVRVQVMRGGVRDGALDHIARPDIGARREVHEPAVARPSRHPAGGTVLAPLTDRDEDLDGAPDEFPVLRPGDVFESGDEAVVPVLDDLLRYLVVQGSGRGTGPLGVLERERPREPCLAYHVQRLLEVGLRLPGEPSDVVGGFRRIQHYLLYGVYDSLV